MKGQKMPLAKKAILAISGLLGSLVLTYFVGIWAIHMAYLERGYKAYGGEYCLIAFVFFASLLAIRKLIDIKRRKYGNSKGRS